MKEEEIIMHLSVFRQLFCQTFDPTDPARGFQVNFNPTVWHVQFWQKYCRISDNHANANRCSHYTNAGHNLKNKQMKKEREKQIKKKE